MLYFWNSARAHVPINLFPLPRESTMDECIRKIFENFSPRIRSRRAKIASTVAQRVTKSTHTMLKVYAKEKSVTKHRVKKAIAINERKPSVSSDELGLDLLFWKYVTVFSHLHYVPDCI